MQDDIPYYEEALGRNTTRAEVASNIKRMDAARHDPDKGSSFIGIGVFAAAALAINSIVSYLNNKEAHDAANRQPAAQIVVSDAPAQPKPAPKLGVCTLDCTK